jgi:hypothetical protein
MVTTERPAWLRVLARGREDDPRVAHDLDLLAAAYGPGAPEAPDRATTTAHDLELLAGAYGEGGTATTTPAGRPDVLAHLRRYRVLYGLGAAVLAVVLLADPVPGPGGGFAAGADAFSTVPAREPGETEPALLPDLQSPVFGVPGEFAVDPTPHGVAPEISVPVAPPPSAGDDEDEVPLRITASGYASVFGGTPVEQPPPEDGLPVAATGGNMTKLSFVRLSGTATVLKLAMVEGTGANLNETSAAIKACPITEAWQAARGVPLADAPAYDAATCVLANVSDGAWTFDLSGLLERGRTNGFALVPGVSQADTFQVTFKPAAAA